MYILGHNGQGNNNAEMDVSTFVVRDDGDGSLARPLLLTQLWTNVTKWADISFVRLTCPWHKLSGGFRNDYYVTIHSKPKLNLELGCFHNSKDLIYRLLSITYGIHFVFHMACRSITQTSKAPNRTSKNYVVGHH